MKHKNIITLLVPPFFLIIAWIIFNWYHNSVISTIPEALQKDILQINPKFDEETIKKLKERKKVSPIYERSQLSSSPSGSSVGPKVSPSEKNSTGVGSAGGRIVP